MILLLVVSSKSSISKAKAIHPSIIILSCYKYCCSWLFFLLITYLFSPTSASEHIILKFKIRLSLQRCLSILFVTVKPFVGSEKPLCTQCSAEFLHHSQLWCAVYFPHSEQLSVISDLFLNSEHGDHAYIATGAFFISPDFFLLQCSQTMYLIKSVLIKKLNLTPTDFYLFHFFWHFSFPLFASPPGYGLVKKNDTMIRWHW